MPNEQRSIKVFLCHAHADRNAVRTLYARLTKDGVDAWLDKEKLLPGQDWELEIRKAVREADVVIVCLSKQFNQAGFRQKEVRWALDTAMEQPEGEIFIIPARLEECDNLESVRKWHWVDLFEEDGYKKLVRALNIRAQKINSNLQSENVAIIESEEISTSNKKEDRISTNGAETVDDELIAAREATIQGWMQALEARESKTTQQMTRLADLTLRLAREMGVSEKRLEDVRIGALLHDLGYMRIPESILYKPDRYTDEEWEIMKKHPQYAVDMLLPAAHLRTALDIPYCHHENWDGTGYPRGLKDVGIPLVARIFSVVDVFDSLITDKPYRMAWPKEEALKYIQEQSGKKFDPKVVEIFIKLM